MNDKTYNGWTNYETWLVGLWLDNDEGSHHECRAIARRAASPFTAGEAIKDFIEECYDLPTTGLVADLVNSGLAQVDWREIGEHFAPDEGEEIEEDETEETP